MAVAAQHTTSASSSPSLPSDPVPVPDDGSDAAPSAGDFIMGPERHDAATAGYFVNHLSLNVNNLTRSLDFYTSVFGMRHMFTMYLTDHLSITYLGHSGGGRNGSAYQTTEELVRFKNNAQGMIGLIYLDVPRGSPIPSPARQIGTLNTIGIIVPDTEAAQRRLEDHGVEIYKRLGEPLPEDGPMSDPAVQLGDVTHLDDDEWQAIRVAMGELNQLNIFAADPDGNMLEILPMDEQGLFG
jgi:lactoylglutathione lyase